MKQAIFVFCFISIATVANSQISETYKNKSLTPTLKKPGFKLSYNDDLPSVELKSLQPKNQIHKMPVKELPNNGVYKGNNGRGSDIYAYAPDNMPCLKPDSTFYSAMPTGMLVKEKKD